MVSLRLILFYLDAVIQVKWVVWVTKSLFVFPALSKLSCISLQNDEKKRSTNSLQITLQHRRKLAKTCYNNLRAQK